MSNLLILNYLTCNDERLLICLKRLLIRKFNFKDLNKLDLITLIYLYTKVFFLQLKLIFLVNKIVKRFEVSYFKLFFCGESAWAIL